MPASVVLSGEGKAVRVPPSDVGMVLKLYGADTNGQFALVEVEFPPGALAPPHRHRDTDEYDYILEGEITIEVGERVIQAPAGTMVVKPRGIFHALWNAGAKPARFLEIMSPAGMEKYIEEAAQLSSEPITPERMMAFAKEHGNEVDMGRVPELVRKYNLKMPGAPGQRGS